MTIEPFCYQGQTWGFVPEQHRQPFINAHGAVDWFMIALLGALAGWCTLRVCRWALLGGGAAGARYSGLSDGVGLIVLTAIVPLLIHIVLSLTWRPIILQRYTSYSALTMYALIGGGIASIKYGLVRKGGIAILLLLYGYQMSLSLPATTRTDYLGAAHLIEAEAAPDDVVLVGGLWLSWEGFRYAMDSQPYPVLPAYSLNAACEKSARLLEGSRADVSAWRVWVVLEPFVFTLPPLEGFEQRLHSLGLDFSRSELPGMNGLFVYRVEKVEGVGTQEPLPASTIRAVTDYGAILADLGFDPANAAAYESARAALQNTWEIEFVRSEMYYSNLALHLAAEGYLDLALRAANHAVTLNSRSAYGLFVLSIVLGEKGRSDEARGAFHKALAVDSVGFVKLYEPIFRSLYWSPNPESARAAIEEMDKLHVFLPLVFFQHGLIPLASKLRLAGGGAN
jgi:tetratricopeptide (TPR) repeat protein